jgi:hypothetical protein
MDVSTNLVENSIKTNTNNNLNTHFFLLDPLSVIIKLAILGNKPIGTKILIQNNVIYFQEPGIFQSITRMFYNSNKTDLQYMYNPIHIACSTFLSKEFIQKTPRLKSLFVFAQNGLKNLIETYKNCSIISLCLNYYYAIITNHVEQKYNDSIFYKDSITSYYTKELIDTLNEQWTQDKIKVILDLIAFLTHDTTASNNVKSLETIMDNNDLNSQKLFSGY